MKAYLITTGVLFGLIAAMHVMRAVAERNMLATEPVGYVMMSSLTLVAAGLSAWAWWLLLKPARS